MGWPLLEIFIFLPVGRVVADVTGNFPVGFPIADNVLVIIALPDFTVASGISTWRRVGANCNLSLPAVIFWHINRKKHRPFSSGGFLPS